MQMSKVSNDDRLTCEIASRITNCSSVTGLFFVESSAKDSSNVAMAFESLIKSIHQKMMNGEFNDRLETFNYFGNDGIRQKALDAFRDQSNNDDDGEMSRDSQVGKRKNSQSGFYRGPDGKMYKKGQPIKLSHTADKMSKHGE